MQFDEDPAAHAARLKADRDAATLAGARQDANALIAGGNQNRGLSPADAAQIAAHEG